ncbi:hypothetical protein Mapa_005427 [Marchantia paleacea]|nr:hypothetical protein Mapa_005427 [Marchantia paleacea]
MTDVPDCGEASVPPGMLTLRGKRLVLKTPTAEDDGPMRIIFSDRITTKNLPQFHRPDGWTIEEMTERRRNQEEDCSKGKRIAFTIHVPENTCSGDEASFVAGSTGLRLDDDAVDWITAKDNAQMRGWCESLGLEAYDKETLEMGDSVGYSLTISDWYNTVRHVLEQRLS